MIGEGLATPWLEALTFRQSVHCFNEYLDQISEAKKQNQILYTYT